MEDRHPHPIVDSSKCTVVELDSTTINALPEDGGESVTVRVFDLVLGGVTVQLCALGASILKILLPPDNTDVVLGFGSIQEMVDTKNPPYLGVVPGRVANRIRRGQLQLQKQGPIHALDQNNPPNHLHGGVVGFSHRVWDCRILESAVQFDLISDHGDQHYPGSVHVTAVYSLQPTPSDSSVKLCLNLSARLVGDKVSCTPVNLTQHSYFNLAGHDDKQGILDHSLKLYCDSFTPVDDTSIPTRTVQPVSKDAVMDWRTLRTLRDALTDYGVQKAGGSLSQVEKDMRDRSTPLQGDLYGFDHNYVVLQRNQQQQQHSSGPFMNLVAVLRHRASQRLLTVRSTAPGVQLYTGNYLDGSVPNTGKPSTQEKQDQQTGHYLRWQGLCLEAQNFPDSVLVDADLHPEFAQGKCPILTPDQPTYEQAIEYTFEWTPVSSHDTTSLAGFCGTDSNDQKYESVEKLWQEMGWNDANGQKSWYDGASSHYETNCPTSIEGVLGGFASLTDVDLDGSLQFVRQLEEVRPSVRSWSQPNGNPTSGTPFRACECGAGLGRVTKGLLLSQSLGIQCCDLVESSPTLLSAAPDHLGDGMAQHCRFFCAGLQLWGPSCRTYAVVWIQWVLSYLTDVDIVSFLRRCGTSLVEDGVIVLKENQCVDSDFEVDLDDCCVTRSGRYWKYLIHQAGLRVVYEAQQTGFPTDIYPVPMMALEVDR